MDQDNLNSFRVRLLFIVPAVTYLLSYLYLALYHGRLNLLSTIVHESGKFSLAENIFYAPHFLGHIPVHIVLALLFVGYFHIFTGNVESNLPPRISIKWLALMIILLVIVSYAISITFFGYESTSDYILQNKQSESIRGHGGSWNLHIPSTMLLYFFIPLYLTLILRSAGVQIIVTGRGYGLILLGISIFLLMTLLVNGSFSTLIQVWQVPRYMAHSVRELATFPLTYFPLPLYFIIKEGHFHKSTRKLSGLPLIILILFSLIFFAGFLYQVFISLSSGVGNLAQKPTFARGGSLSIPYLLASHYFEHFLDTLFFLLMVLAFNRWKMPTLKAQ